VSDDDADNAIWVKSPDRLHRRGATSLETPLETLDGYLTPAAAFFVCNVTESQRVKASTFRLELQGDALAEPCTLTLDQIAALPRHTVRAYLECAGNQRALFGKIQGQHAQQREGGEDVPWVLGGIGMAEWSGPRLRDVLALGGLRDTARWIAPLGLDHDNPECPIEIPMPVEKALHEDTILALTMNGHPLPADHGFPVRAIVPGWIGTYSVKWVGKITVSSREIRNYRTDEYYVIDGVTVTRQNIKSSLALPFPAMLGPGIKRIHGYARSPDQPIRSVEWSDNGGETWHEADIISPNERYGWVRFAFAWKASPGEHRLMTRATDESGETQPAISPFNPGTLLFNAIIPHPVTVA
jgi:DMSO/TMAO reductase YedYZ molybdopterin-dependent catalytic subunit